MRVIAGSARGVQLESPKDSSVRPTLDRVREAVFSILGERVLDATVLDLFAGTGAIGIEALSRGAARSVFVEEDRTHRELIQRNLAKTKLTDRAHIIPARIPADLARARGAYDIVYVDPPRSYTDYQTLFDEVAEHGLLADGGQLLLESPANTELAADSSHFTRIDRRRFGGTEIHLFS